VVRREQVVEMRLGSLIEPRDEGVDVGVGAHLGGVEEELLAPNQPRLLAQFDDLREEALEDGEAEALANLREAGVVRQRLVEVVPEVPAVSQVQAGVLDELALRADALEEHDELELEEDDRVDAGAADGRVLVGHPGADEAEVELGVEMPVEVVRWHVVFERGEHSLVKVASFHGPKHGGLWRGESNLSQPNEPGDAPHAPAGLLDRLCQKHDEVHWYQPRASSAT
jgi:hypothetical protein